MKIKDKAYWFGYHQDVRPCPNGGMLGIGFGMAIITMSILVVALLAVMPEHATGGMVAIGGTIRKSLELKEARHKKLEIVQDILSKPQDVETRKMLTTLRDEIEVLNEDIKNQEFYENSLVDADTTRREQRQQSAGVGVIDRDDAIETFYKRDRKLQAFKTDRDAYAAGQWILATIYGSEKAKRYCQMNGLKQIRDAAREGVNEKGGWLVPDVLEQAIIDLRERFGVFRRFSGMRTMSSDHARVPRRAGGLTAYPVGEGVEITDSTKGWSNVELIARKWGVLAKYSSEVAEDAVISIAEDLTEEGAYALARAEDNAGFNGDGSAAHHGITGIVKKFDSGPTVYAGAIKGASGHDTFAEIDSTDLTNMMGLLPEYAWELDPAWYCSQTCWAVVMQRLAANAGGNTKGDLAGPMPKEFLGYPVRVTQTMRTSTGDLSNLTMLMFGSLRSATTFGSRRGITMAVSDQRYFETDELAIRVTERFDINVHDIGDATTAGPMSALIGE